MNKTVSPAPRGQTTVLPTFYVITYAGHADDARFPERIALAPPDLLHLGHEVPFKSGWGTAVGYDSWGFQPLAPAEVEQRIAHLTAYIAALHKAGVKVIMPYICNQTVFGDHETRAGFWRFYDRWEDYAAFGFTDKPAQDPLDWMQRNQQGNLTLRKNLAELLTERGSPLKAEEMEQAKFLYRYRPCPSHDAWRRYLLAVVENVARCGYDGLFVDNNVIRCYGACCQEKFRQYLQRRYSARQLRTLFGFKEAKDARLGMPREGLLWVETQRFRAESVVEMLRRFKQTGEKFRKGFQLVANWGPIAHLQGVDRRRSEAHDVGAWGQVCDFVMLEEMHHPGRLGASVVVDYTLQYQFARAHGTRAAVLPYVGRNLHSVELAHAECAAEGGGAYVHAGADLPEVRAKYARFVAAHPHLYEGLRSYADVAVAFCFEQLYWENVEHLRHLYPLVECLRENHVLFDIVTERQLTRDALRRYKTLILPHVTHLSAAQVKAIEAFVTRGGALVMTGAAAGYDEKGQARQPSPAFSGAEPQGKEKVAVSACGKGVCVRARDISDLVPPKPFALHLLLESEVNDIEYVYQRLKEAESKALPPAAPVPLLKYLEQVAQHPVAITDPRTPHSLRFNACARRTDGRGNLVLHLVNYDVPRPQPQAAPLPPVPVEKIVISLPLPPGWKAVNVRAYDPDSPAAQSLTFEMEQGRVKFIVPHVRIYQVVEVQATTSAK